MITNEMKAAKKLDDFLSIFPVNTTNVNVTHSEIIGPLLKAKGIEQRESEEIVRKLEKDGYIREVLIGMGFNFFITFEGELFRENGGYEKQIERDNADIEREKRIGNYMAYGAMGAALFSFFYLAGMVFAYGIDHHWWLCQLSR